MGSDGLFDNLYDEDIKQCLSSNMLEWNQNFRLKSVDDTATCIGDKAYKLSKTRAYDSPFAKGAREAGQMYYGGKKDDITVIVSHIVKA